MVYHVRITTKSNHTHDELMLDLTKEQLTKRILEVYRKGEPIVISGKSIPIDDLERIRINETDELSQDLLHSIREERKRSSVIVDISDEWYVTKKGKDVTDEIITEPPGSSKTISKTKESLTYPFVIEDEKYLNSRELTAILFKTQGTGKSKISIYSKVEQEGLDLYFYLSTVDDYKKLAEFWKNHPANPKNPRGPYVSKPKEPKLNYLFSIRTNIVDREFDLDNNVSYAWVLNNTHSRLQGKTVTTRIKLHSSSQISMNALDNLPSVELFKNKIPNTVFDDIKDANDCYISGHNRQSAIMFRKALESSILVKVQQTGLPIEILQNPQGDELKLSKKLDVMLTKKLITNNLKNDIEQTVKFFGDSGVHTRMTIVPEDIRSIIEPKFRKFLESLSLKL